MRSRLTKIILSLSLLAAILLPAAASAAIITSDKGESATISASQTINDDLYIAGERVLIEGTVNGDVYAAGSTVTIKGTVNGSVFAAGQDVYISGKVSGGVRVAGQNLRISNAAIGGGLSGFGQNLTVERDVTIGGGLNFAGSAVTLRGSVANSVVGAGSDITVAGNLMKNVNVATEKLTLEKTAIIGGNLDYLSSSDLTKESGAVVTGETSHKQPPKRNTDKAGEVLMVLWWMAAIYFTGAVMLWLTPRLISGPVEQIAIRPLPSFGWGLLALLLSIPLLIILLISFIGLPLAFILGAVMAISLYLAQFWVALALGNAIADRAKWHPNAYANAFIGLIILTLLGLVPVLGGIIKLLVAVLGFGAVILYVVHGAGRQKPTAKPTKT